MGTGFFPRRHLRLGRNLHQPPDAQESPRKIRERFHEARLHQRGGNSGGRIAELAGGESAHSRNGMFQQTFVGRGRRPPPDQKVLFPHEERK